MSRAEKQTKPVSKQCMWFKINGNVYPFANEESKNNYYHMEIKQVCKLFSEKLFASLTPPLYLITTVITQNYETCGVVQALVACHMVF